MEWNKDMSAAPANASIVVNNKWGIQSGIWKKAGTVENIACDCLITDKGYCLGKFDGWMLESDYNLLPPPAES